MRNSLKPLKHDPKDFHLKHLKKLGVALPATYEKVDFQVCTPRTIRNQGSDETCTARTFAEYLEAMDNVDIAEEYQWMQTAKVNGIDPQTLVSEGTDLRSAANVPVKVGGLERKFCPTNFDTDGVLKCADPVQYDSMLAYNALVHRKPSYFRADTYTGAKDRFDSITLTMKHFNVPVAFGLMFDSAWLGQTYIDTVSPAQQFGHAMLAYRYKVVDGKEYIGVQQSAGTNVGENGTQYFSREVINSGMELGALCLIKVDENTLAYLKQQTIFGKLSALLSRLSVMVASLFHA